MRLLVIGTIRISTGIVPFPRSAGGLVERIEADVVGAQEVLVLRKPPQEVLLREPPSPAGLCGGNALQALLEAVSAGKLAVAFDLALLTQDASQDARGFRCLRRR